jgi:hypothetical protein
MTSMTEREPTAAMREKAREIATASADKMNAEGVASYTSSGKLPARGRLWRAGLIEVIEIYVAAALAEQDAAARAEAEVDKANALRELERTTEVANRYFRERETARAEGFAAGLRAERCGECDGRGRQYVPPRDEEIRGHYEPCESCDGTGQPSPGAASEKETEGDC